MRSIKLYNKIVSDVEFLNKKVENYSFAFRKIYLNIDKILDVDFRSYICQEFNLNEIEYRSVCSEAKSRFSKTMKWKDRTESEIVALTKEIEELKKLREKRKLEVKDKDKINDKDSVNKLTRKILKKESQLNYKNKSLCKEIVFGKKSVLRKITHLSNQKHILEDKLHNAEENELKGLNEAISSISLDLAEKQSEFHSNRLMSFHLMGEANQKGNRFITFKLDENKIVFKPNRNEKVEIEFSYYKSYKKDLIKLQELIDDKLISVSLMISKEGTSLCFDDAIFSGYAINEKDRKEEVKKIKELDITKEEKTKIIKQVYKNYYRDLEERMLKGKSKRRLMSVDLNPDYIGLSILDKIGDECEVIHTFQYDLTESTKSLDRECTKEYRKHIRNKRKNAICHIWKDIFKTASYYKCGRFCYEDLEIKEKDLQNTQANRKVNNVWHRDLSNELINKYCTRLGIIQVKVNPCYTSLSGNLLHDYTDPINASIEIGRRGIFQFKKNKFFPKIDIGTITDTMSRLNESRDVPCIKDCETWKEVYEKLHKSGLRYRATLNDTQRKYKVVGNLSHLNIAKICFFRENFLSLPINS